MNRIPMAILLLLCSVVFSPGMAADKNENQAALVYEKAAPVKCRTQLDKLLFADWKRCNLPVPPEASDPVLLRRVYLDFAGRLPTLEETESYLADKSEDKYEKLLEKLLSSEDFVNYRSMLLGDALRVKSEFPINLWPNAVQAYSARIRAFLTGNESVKEFVSSLLLSRGSNFRVPEVNFYRACANKTGEGIAGAAALTLLGLRYDKLPEQEKKSLASLFSRIKFKSTMEWKEEIVYQLPLEKDEYFFFPGRVVKGRKGELPGEVFQRYLFEFYNPIFCRAMVNRMWQSLFGRGIVEPADDLSPDNTPANPELLEYLASYFAVNGYDLRKLLREMALTSAYRASSLSGKPEERAEAEQHFAVFTVRRIPGEVLDDMICDLSGAKRNYSSVIPEPFSYFPPDGRTVLLEDGSVSNAFLLLFGRPARDSGLLEERNNSITAKQRQYLFNSGELYKRTLMVGRRPEFKGKKNAEKLNTLYLLCYSRPATAEEKKFLLDEWKKLRGRAQWRFFNDIVWALINSSEFIYQH